MSVLVPAIGTLRSFSHVRGSLIYSVAFLARLHSSERASPHGKRSPYIQLVLLRQPLSLIRIMILDNNQTACAIAVACGDILQHLALLFNSTRALITAICSHTEPMNIPSPAPCRSCDDPHYRDGRLLSGLSTGPLSQIVASVSAHAAACLMS